MKTLYFDTFSGISGDMTVGALLALGLPLDLVRTALATLPLGGFEVSAEDCFVNGIGAVRFGVRVGGEEEHGLHGHRTFREVRGILERGGLDGRVGRIALDVFARLAAAEGRVHGVAAEDVTFHEVGAVDSIVDIVAAAVGFSYFGIERFVVGTIPLGSGVVRSQHGPIPVPGPATADLLAGFVTRLNDGAGELVTPTGAAILATLAEQDEGGGLRIDKVGYGAGTMVLEDRPNLLRLLLGEGVTAAGHDTVVLLETNIDDASPEIYAHVMEQLFSAGARDVFLTPIQMKKNRPATMLSVLCAPVDRERMAAIVMRETTAIGVRYVAMNRVILPRHSRTVTTEFGDVRVKVAIAPDGTRNIAPEHDDCRRLATERGVPLKVVYHAAMAAAWGS